ncbi:DUF736 family protein [Paracoccus zhejiangensis]|uniref:Uncharacterized protein n=1 Tax=Paracoccus zhejiangensis TaxID=1077935 RepID=A0A2H5F1S7_9RHOB|nr:DUF736 family protein [Paracoccus zhejiangensis]AUH65500.1 hypothetical protein CX676_16145 [Paracoccus zhejiangensis]
MAQIGQFTRTPSGYFGQLRTLSLDLELTFVPIDDVESENALRTAVRKSTTVAAG